MQLGELITALESCEDKSLVLEQGFHHPHSYRGYYDELAFEPLREVTIASMVHDAKRAVGQSYTGWKGGEFTMTYDSVVNIAYEGTTGRAMTTEVLKLMLSTAHPEMPPERLAEIRVLPEWAEPPTDPVRVLFSINEYDRDGDISSHGIFLHFEDTRIKVAHDPVEWDKFINQLIDMSPELIDAWREAHG